MICVARSHLSENCVNQRHTTTYPSVQTRYVNMQSCTSYSIATGPRSSCRENAKHSGDGDKSASMRADNVMTSCPSMRMESVIINAPSLRVHMARRKACLRLDEQVRHTVVYKWLGMVVTRCLVKYQLNIILF